MAYSLPVRLLLLVVVISVARGRTAQAQPDNPVYVDDSPRAWELFQLARDQATDNQGEAVRLYQELLDDYGEKLIRAREGSRDEFRSVRGRVLADLLADEGLLERYRLMQTTEAQRLLEDGRSVRVARTRPLTAPGLEAMLRQAQQAMESARFRAATVWLEEAAEHPDLAGRDAAQCWFMSGLCSHYLGDGERLAGASAALTALDEVGRAGLDELARLVAGGAGPDVPRSVTSLDVTAATDLDELVAQTIWSVRLDRSLINRRYDEQNRDRPFRSPGFERRLRAGDLTTAAAALADSVVFVNEGHTVRALDRFSGRSVWDGPYLDQPSPTIIDGTEDAGDLNTIAVQGDALVTLTGHAYEKKRSSQGKIICLEALTGDLRWARSLDRLGGDEQYEGLFPYGGPVIAEGNAIVLARMVTRQWLTGCYVVALDVEDGSLRWIRHIASSGGQSGRPRPFSTLVHDGGELFVATAVGAVACLDASSGAVRWLRRSNVPVNIRGRDRRPWEMGGPVIAGSRVIALSPDHRGLVMLDRTTGDLLQRFDAVSPDRFNAPAYLLADDSHLYAIGTEVRAVRLEAPDRLSWKLPPPASSVSPDDPEPSASMELTGRIQLVDGALVVPTTEELLVVDCETGRIMHRLQTDAPGNPLAVDAQLILAGADALSNYMSLQRAEEMLRRRITAAPADPQPALSLLQLAWRVGAFELMLESADLALQAIEAAPEESVAAEARQRLFGVLLEMHARDAVAGRAEGEAFYEMLGAIADTAEQRVEHRLAWAAWLAPADPQEAARICQSILTEPALAGTVREEGGILRPAADWTAARLGSLIAEHGRTVYAAQDAEARRTLSGLLRVDPIDEAALSALARQFPYAEASLEAALTASDLHRARGDWRGALATLSAAYHIAPLRERTGPLLGPFIEICLQQGNFQQARAMLDRVIGAFGDISMNTAEGRRSAAAWRADLAPEYGAPRRPSIGRVRDPAEVLPGRLLPAHPAARIEGGLDRVLLLGEDELQMIPTAALTASWRLALDDPDARLLHLDDERLLLWTGEEAEDPRIAAVDTAEGKLLWTSPRLSDHVEPPLRSVQGVLSEMPGGLPFDPSQTLPCLGHDTVYLVQRTGGVAAFDRADGRIVLWSVEADRTLEQVHLAIAHEFGLVLAGLDRSVGARGGAGELEPRLVVLDPRTGRLLHRLRPQSREGVIWMAADPFGGLLCASSEGIELIDLLRGRRRWMNISFEAMESRRGVLAERHAFVESRTRSLVSIDLEHGTSNATFAVDELRDDWDPLSLDGMQAIGDSLLTRYQDRIIRYDAAGAILGADVVSTSTRDYRWLLTGDGRLVVISLNDSRQVPVEGGFGRQRQWIYGVYVLTESCRVEDEPVELTTRQGLLDARLKDGWLLLSGESETLAVPMPTEGP